MRWRPSSTLAGCRCTRRSGVWRRTGSSPCSRDAARWSPTFGVDEVLDLFEAREAVECGLAYIAARRANAEDLAELRRLVLAAEQAREGSDHMAFLRDDHEIHSLLVHMVPNPLLQDAAERLLLHSLRFWRSYWSSRPAQYATMISHADLLTALEAGDTDAAESAMRQHISASLKLLSSSF
jgi:DNA-binding GntR family transcriptional regulator